MLDRDQIPPFLKWAGGKRWFIHRHANLLPLSFTRYFEPFLGSAAVFFHLKPKRAVLADINSELIDAYNAIKIRPDLVCRYLQQHQMKHSADYYYQVRAANSRSICAKAARTIYLNRTCWNALYRVNLKGQFNVPIGTKQNVLLPTDNFFGVSALLQNADLCTSDFESIIERARKRDFVFVDPPYTVNHNLNGFLKYNKKLFDWSDQERLRSAVDDAARRGVKVLVTNADHASVNRLYRDFARIKVKRPSSIAASGSHRGEKSELVIKCW